MKSTYKFLGISIGIVYLWFGTLKYFPNVSPAEEVAVNTIDMLTFKALPSEVSILLLAIWETAIGLLLLLSIFPRVTIRLALIHMAFTFFPLIFFPLLTFENAPFQLTLLGQYIIKNLVIVASLFVLYKQHSPHKSSE